MLHYCRACVGTLLFLSLTGGFSASAQSPDAVNAPLREVHVDGEKILTEAQVVAITGLVPGAQIGRDDLQAAADKLVHSGLFAKVSYNFHTNPPTVIATFHVAKSPPTP